MEYSSWQSQRAVHRTAHPLVTYESYYSRASGYLYEQPDTCRKDNEAQTAIDAGSVNMELRESPTYYPSDVRLSKMSRLVCESILRFLLIGKQLRWPLTRIRL